MMRKMILTVVTFSAMALWIQQSSAQEIERNAYFGDLHVHTSWSFDAYINSVRTNPDDAYRYATGYEIPLAGGETTKIGRPLDFMAVTDHAEYLGVIRKMTDPDHPVSKHPQADAITSGNPRRARMAFLQIAASAAAGNQPIDNSFLKGPNELSNLWKEMVAVADKYYRPGEFTTFAAFEWSSTNKFVNLHRNIIFRDTKNVSEKPFSMFDSYRPEELWQWMDGERAKGITLMAIPHNANMSKGRMYPLDDSYGNPIDRKYAETRRRNEPVNEVTQIKGQSMAHSVLNSTDEFADFELFNFTVGSAAGDAGEVPPGSYARVGLQRGLELKKSIEVNPFKIGFIGSSDSHNSNSPAAENNYTGSSGKFDNQVKTGQMSTNVKIMKRGSGGLAGVWAEENTREAIYDAIMRRETFATSGSRIRVRFFAGYDFQDAYSNAEDMARDGYAKGIPMGGELASRSDGKPPTFLVWAIKDAESANLDRIQIIKGWMENGIAKEHIFNIALSDGRKENSEGDVPSNGATVDLTTGEYSTDVGDVELRATWQDPEFDAQQEAYYFVRVLENPTPRWSTLYAIRIGADLSDMVPGAIQERAWSSPIWYSP